MHQCLSICRRMGYNTMLMRIVVVVYQTIIRTGKTIDYNVRFAYDDEERLTWLYCFRLLGYGPLAEERPLQP